MRSNNVLYFTNYSFNQPHLLMQVNNVLYKSVHVKEKNNPLKNVPSSWKCTACWFHVQEKLI